MMIVRGILGLLQSVLLPGLILIRVGKLRGGIAEQLLRIFPLSLLSSYLLVFLLAALHIYTRPAMFTIIAIETVAMLWLYRKALLRPIGQMLSAIGEALRVEFQPLTEFLSEPPCLEGWIWAVSGCLALSAVLWGIHLCRLNFGTIFSGWDTLFSWNTYAMTWAENTVPRVGGMYPQLLASNWSISYLLQGENPVQFFNTLLPPLFFLMIEWMLFDLGFHRRESGFFFAAIIARYMMKKLMGDQLFDGYMDVPAAAMSLLSIYTFIKAENRSLREQQQTIVLGVLFAAGAAVTKQSGFVALLAAPLAIAILLRDAFRGMSRKQKVLLLLAALLTVAPWYLHCMLYNTRGQERELIAEGIMDYNRTFDIRYRIHLAIRTLGKYRWCFLLSLIALPFVPRRYQVIFFLMSWPLTIIWAVSYSYDARNLGPALPFIALLCGLGLAGIGRLLFRLCGRLGKLPLLIPLILLTAAALFVLTRSYPGSKLTEDQWSKQQALFGERLNHELLYDIIGETHSGFDIYTDYPAQFLSGYAECCSAADLTDEFQVRGVLEGTKINWLLLPQIMPNNSDPSKALIEQCISDGRCELVRCSNGYYKSYCLYELNH